LFNSFINFIYNFTNLNRDVKLIEAKLIKNCFDDEYDTQHPYLCIFTIFDEIDALKHTKIITLKYEFEEINLLRTDSNFPYFKSTQNYSLNYISYDFNNLNNKMIENLNLDIILPQELNIIDLENLPKDALIKKNKKIVRWKHHSIGYNKNRNFSMLLPPFDIFKCKKAVSKAIIYYKEIIYFYLFILFIYFKNAVGLNLSAFTQIQIIFTLSIAFLIIVTIGYLYINHEEDEDKWKLVDELNSMEKFKD